MAERTRTAGGGDGCEGLENERLYSKEVFQQNMQLRIRIHVCVQHTFLNLATKSIQHLTEAELALTQRWHQHQDGQRR